MGAGKEALAGSIGLPELLWIDDIFVEGGSALEASACQCDPDEKIRRTIELALA